jgi:hypothetical protein
MVVKKGLILKIVYCLKILISTAIKWKEILDSLISRKYDGPCIRIETPNKLIKTKPTYTSTFKYSKGVNYTVAL